MTTDDPYLFPTFIERLEEAADAIATADAFDVHSEDPASLAEWNRLLHHQAAMLEKLIDLVQQHGDQLKAALKTMAT